ncbi:glutathione S-transferase C-terminal domain-containing protein [Nonomuraea sp. NPDC050310]|uniref:glutathione S-transferase C-terminal domain-containing protein n=1 Tax=Nonomuraea sp. NPDC050310 TaxID=3154935 RepID=UPI0034081E56
MSVSTHAYAGPVDLATYGPYTRGEPIYPFKGRIGTEAFPAEPGRYHLYVAWVCPYAHRAAIVRKLKGLEEVVSLSYVDDERDGRGWAFRERRGHDPINGFTLLEQAYEATEKGYGGHISVPVLWDGKNGVIVSNDFPDITLDLATAFEQWADTSVDLYPVALRPEIDELNAWIYQNVNRGVSPGALERLDERLSGQRFLLGETITEPDVRLWVTLVRLGPEHDLASHRHLWTYAHTLHELPAFRDTTEAWRDR